MELRPVMPRAIVFDVYKTILEVLPPPADAAAGWETLWREMFGGPARLTLAAFGAACERVVARDHAAARTAGIAFPEVYWPEVLREVVPELAGRSQAAQAEFAFRQTQLWHTVRMMPGAGETLRTLREGGVWLGIASNAQPYTWRELDEALAGAGLDRGIFEPELCFWSFAHGFSKPDPHVFRLLTARLRARGVAAGETLMVGDRLDNDIAPARAQGWRTWQLRPAAAPGGGGGDWKELMEFLAGETA